MFPPHTDTFLLSFLLSSLHQVRLSRCDSYFAHTMRTLKYPVRWMNALKWAFHTVNPSSTLCILMQVKQAIFNMQHFPFLSLSLLCHSCLFTILLPLIRVNIDETGLFIHTFTQKCCLFFHLSSRWVCRSLIAIQCTCSLFIHPHTFKFLLSKRLPLVPLNRLPHWHALSAPVTLNTNGTRWAQH